MSPLGGLEPDSHKVNGVHEDTFDLNWNPPLPLFSSK